ncbi:hypothetical protein AX17_001990 [Amanita inopinata Kibby_2008]|nr:hypothetical protein AX17_001990 [Amanita inopinata Kibby_2008]
MSRRTAFSDSSEDEGPDLWDSELSEASTAVEIERFRLLIIGKTGCGKTTILSKVCGEDVADKPTTTRGIHDIEKEMEFKNNKLFVVHDSEGFEAGKEDEFKVVTNFINSRGLMRSINERLHAIWYCLTTNARPIQQSEEMFFSVKHEVPIVAIFTKFDLFVEAQLQQLVESAEDKGDDDIDDDEFERQAEKSAMDKFEKHYKSVLLKKPYPPQAVVAVSNINHSTPMENRLEELIKATSRALREAAGEGDTQANLDSIRLGALFATAQMTSLPEKYRYSVYNGMPEVIKEGRTRSVSVKLRPALIKVWNTVWTRDPTPILSAFETYVENHPRTFGNKLSLTHPGVKKLRDIEREACRTVQLVSDLTIIMTEIFLRKAQGEAIVREIVKRYPSTPAFSFVQEKLLKLHWWPAYDAERGELELLRYRNETRKIIDGAVRSSIPTRMM